MPKLNLRDALKSFVPKLVKGVTRVARSSKTLQPKVYLKPSQQKLKVPQNLMYLTAKEIVNCIYNHTMHNSHLYVLYVNILIWAVNVIIIKKTLKHTDKKQWVFFFYHVIPSST